MKRSTFIILAVLVAGGSTAARAQSPAQPRPEATKPRDPAPTAKSSIDPRDSVAIADVQRAADDLALAVQEAVRKITENPELKVAALKVATNAVNAAQVIVSQQAATLQATLDALAKEVAAISAQQSKPKTH